MILPGGYGKALDTILGRAYWPFAVCGQPRVNRGFNPMKSTWAVPPLAA